MQDGSFALLRIDSETQGRGIIPEPSREMHTLRAGVRDPR